MSVRAMIGVVVLFVSPLGAAEPGLPFRTAGPGLFEFDTGPLRGRLKLDGRYQGVYPIVDAVTQNDLTMPPGVFSPYRVFSTGRRYGDAARDWPTQPRLCDDGAIAVRWAAAKEHPVALAAVYRWTKPDTLDLEIAATPEVDLPAFELFISSYFTKNFRAAVYLKSAERPDERPRFVPIDPRPDSKGGYVMFPRDPQAVTMIQDGRWKIPPSPVDWAIERWLAAPLVIRRDAAAGITAVMMAPTTDCFAISSPWNPATPQGGGYRSLYLSLFGRDLKAGQTAQARCRLVLGRDISDEKAVALYEAYTSNKGR
jgi:hypothetical protein